MERLIYDKLEAYLRGDTSLEDFRTWLAILVVENESVPTLAHAIEYTVETASSESQLNEALNALRAVPA